MTFRKSAAEVVGDKWESASVLKELKRKDRVRVCRVGEGGALVPLVSVELTDPSKRGTHRDKAEEKRRWLAETNPGVEYVLDPPVPTTAPSAT